MRRWLVNFILRPTWVVFRPSSEAEPELGLMVWGFIFSLYKAEVLTYNARGVKVLRLPYKREFGESLHPQSSGVN
jgi:hypothetical protein